MLVITSFVCVHESEEIGKLTVCVFERINGFWGGDLDVCVYVCAGETKEQ